MNIAVNKTDHACTTIATCCVINSDIISRVKIWRLSFLSLFTHPYVMWEIMQCMYCHDELLMCSLKCYFGIYFPYCFATWEMNTKRTLSITVRHSSPHIILCLMRFYWPSMLSDQQWNNRSHHQLKFFKKMYSFVVNILPSDGLAPL